MRLSGPSTWRRAARAAVVTAALGALPALALGTGTGPSTAAGSAGSPVGSPVAAADRAGIENFVAGVPYGGTFADPTVLRVGDTFVASATTTANLNLPIMTSTDLVTWTPRPPLEDWSAFSRWRLYNDAMVVRPAWAAVRGTRDGVELISQWAPSLARVGDHYVAAFSAAVRLSPRKSCIGVAVASAPLGPYVPVPGGPLVCFGKAPLGAIDPEVFVHRDGSAYLLWKNEGVPGRLPPRIMARRLDATGTAFAPGSGRHELVRRDRGWEGGVIENPSMVRHRGRFYLLYSGNQWRTEKYATGYAVCETPVGPCEKPAKSRLLRSGQGVQGTGGADAFVDGSGTLRMAYAAFDAGSVGEGQPRRLHVATLVAHAGELQVVDRG